MCIIIAMPKSWYGAGKCGEYWHWDYSTLKRKPYTVIARHSNVILLGKKMLISGMKKNSKSWSDNKSIHFLYGWNEFIEYRSTHTLSSQNYHGPNKRADHTLN